MTFAEATRKCLSNYATFSGRASRSEFWWFALFVVLGAMVPVLIGAIVAGATASGTTGTDFGNRLGFGALFFFGIAGLFYLAMLMPTWAVGVRRFHDRDLSGWVYLALILVGFIPYIGLLGSLAALVISVLPTKPGANRFGPDPLQGSAEVFA